LGVLMRLWPLSADADVGLRTFGPVVHRRSVASLSLGGLAFLLLLTPADGARATSEWRFQEIYSNADGSIQFIELYTTSDFQDLLWTNNVQLRAQFGTTVRTFTFDSDLPWWAYGETADHTLLISSAGYQALDVPPPADYWPLDAGGMFFDPTAALVVISLLEGATVIDAVAFDANAMSQCAESINYPGPILAPNTPENFWGDEDFPLSCCEEDGDCPSDGIACTDQQCSVASATCSYVPIDEVCDDGNVCTADSCDAVTGCGNTPIEGCQMPVPTLSEWGLALVVGLLVIAGAILARPRKRTEA